MHLSPAAGNALFSILFFCFCFRVFFVHLLASFWLSACTPAEANQAEGKINRQITSVRRRRRRLDEYFCCSFWAARFLFSSLVFFFLFLFLVFIFSL